MQTAAPEAFDIEREPDFLKRLYGLDQPHCRHFSAQCLMARRMVERGVRFVQIYSGGMENQRSWDGHEDIVGNHRGFARETDQPIAGLLADLEQRGLLDETLVIWGGEFGRLPISQKGKNPGRDRRQHSQRHVSRLRGDPFPAERQGKRSFEGGISDARRLQEGSRRRHEIHS
jgi:hypothetical protein